MVWLYDIGSTILGALYAWRVPAAIAGIVAIVVLATIARRRGWIARLRSHPRTTAAILVPALAIALPLGWYLASPLVLSANLDEPPPVVAVASPRIPVAAPSASVTEISPGPASSSGSGPSSPAPSAVATPTPTPTPTTVALIDRRGMFHGSDDFHFGRGTARLIETAPGSFVVRLESFAVRNGPDLYVYLSPKADGYAEGAVELGRLKADTGNQNYVVPAGALGDPARAASVVIWCRQFSHLFATAPLGR